MKLPRDAERVRKPSTNGREMEATEGRAPIFRRFPAESATLLMRSRRRNERSRDRQRSVRTQMSPHYVPAGARIGSECPTAEKE